MRIHHRLSATTIDSPIFAKLASNTNQKMTAPQKSKITLQGTVNYGNYLLKQFVGSGAFSKVYRAIDRVSGQTVAIKYLRKDCWYDPRATLALIREYEILRHLNHPGILAVHGWGTTPGGSFFLVTDFIDGGNLETWCSITKPSIGQILKVIREIASAITVAHSAQIIHGDLKPANVLIDSEGKMTLCDFGLSRYATDPDDLPRGGTAGFLAPEQISDAFGPVTKLTDVYGLGGLFYALITGQPPMTGRDLPEILANVLSQKLPAAPLQNSDVFSLQVNKLILNCLQKEPQRRLTSIQELAIKLENLNDL